MPKEIHTLNLINIKNSNLTRVSATQLPEEDELRVLESTHEKNFIQSYRDTHPFQENNAEKQCALESEQTSQPIKCMARKPSQLYTCKICNRKMISSHALGGHMSKTHPGKSLGFNMKFHVRQCREIEREKLLLAKVKYFSYIGYDYLQLKKSSEGKNIINSSINRAKVRQLKLSIRNEDIISYHEKEQKIVYYELV